MLRISTFLFVIAVVFSSTLFGQQQVIFIQLNTKLLDNADQYHPLDSRLESEREYLSLSQKDPLFSPEALGNGDVELIEDDCFLPTHKLIYRDVTYVLSLDCNGARKYANASKFLPSQKELENDFVFSRELAGLLLNRENELENLEPSPLEQTNTIDAEEMLSELADLAEDHDEDLIEPVTESDPNQQIEDLENGIEDEVDSRESYMQLLQAYLAEEHQRTWEEDQQWLNKRVKDSESLTEERDDLALEDEDITKEIERSAPVPLVLSEMGRIDNSEHEKEVIDYLHTFIDAMSPLDMPVILSQMDYVVEGSTYIAKENSYLDQVYAIGFKKTEAMLEAEPELLEGLADEDASADAIEEDLDIIVITIQSTELQLHEEVEADEADEMMQLLGMVDFEIDTF